MLRKDTSAACLLAGSAFRAESAHDNRLMTEKITTLASLRTTSQCFKKRAKPSVWKTETICKGILCKARTDATVTPLRCPRMTNNDRRSMNVLVYVGYYYTKNSVKISSTGAFMKQKHKHVEGPKPVAADQVPDTLETAIFVM